MRVAVYVPADAPARFRRRGEARVRRAGHEFAGFVVTPAEAEAVRRAGLADRVAADRVHAPDLVPWLVLLDPPRPSSAAVGLALAGAWAAVRERPLRAAAAAVGVAGVAGLVALPLLLGPERGPDRDRLLLPPPSPPAASPAGPAQAPASPRATAPARPEPLPLPDPSGAGGGLPEPTSAGVIPAPSEPPEPSRAPTPPSPPATSPPTSPPASPAPPGPPEDERCILRMAVLGVVVTLCVG